MDKTGNISTPLLQKAANPITKIGNWLSLRNVLRFAPKRSFSMLDVGCGYDASLLMQLRGHYYKAVGMDSAVCDSVKNYAACTFVEGDLRVTLQEIRGMSFDFITAINIVEHIDEATHFLCNLRELLAPDGIMVVLVPSWLDKSVLEFLYFKSILRHDVNCRMSINEHKMYYGKRDIWPLLIKAGFLPSEIDMYYAKFGLSTVAVMHNGRGRGMPTTKVSC